VNERFLRFESTGAELVGVLTEPSAESRTGVLLVHPFGEEKKFAHRVLTSAAWQLAASGFAVLRFDLSGCGDSFGEFRDAGLSLWVDQVKTAAEVLRRETGCDRIALLGLRLGASLCRLAAPDVPSAGPIVLWEPVLSGKQYIEALWRKKLIKDMMTAGRGKTSFEEETRKLDANGFIDLDGWDIGRNMVDELPALDLGTVAAPSPAGMLAVQITFNGKVGRELTAFAQAERAAGSKVELVGIRERPIWDRIDIVPANELITLTVKGLVRMSQN